MASGRDPRGRTQGDRARARVGIGLVVLAAPGEPLAMYQRETDQEDFLVLSGEALLVIEGEERPLQEWDFVHCPAGTKHVMVGVGAAPCTVFTVGAREHHTVILPEGTMDGAPDSGAYIVDEAALRHGAGVEEETTDADVAHARFQEPEPTRYRNGWLPSRWTLDSGDEPLPPRAKAARRPSPTTLARCGRSSTSSTATARSSPSRRSTVASACSSADSRPSGSKGRSPSSGAMTPGRTSS